MEKWGLLFLVYMAGVATPFIILFIGSLCSNKPSIRDYLWGGEDE